MAGGHTRAWKTIARGVWKLPKRSDQAPGGGTVRRVRALHRLWRTSRSPQRVAVRRVTQEHHGQKTAGMDGRQACTPDESLAVGNTLRLPHEAQPVRRVWSPKPAPAAHRPGGLPPMVAKALQALVHMALAPPGEARFAPHRYGVRPGRSTWEAIGALDVRINQKPPWVLEGDRATCVDRASCCLLHVRTTPARQSREGGLAGAVPVQHTLWSSGASGTRCGALLVPQEARQA